MLFLVPRLLHPVERERKKRNEFFFSLKSNSCGGFALCAKMLRVRQSCCLVGIQKAFADSPVRGFASAPLLKEFNWQDPLNYESLLTEEEKMVRDVAHDYAQKNLMPRVLKANREEIFHRYNPI